MIFATKHMLSIINVLTKMKNITLNETAKLIYTHRDKGTPGDFSSFRVSDLSLYGGVKELSKSDIRLEYYVVSKTDLPEYRGDVPLSNDISLFYQQKNFFCQTENGGFQFEVKDGESNESLMNALYCAATRSKSVFFRISGLPSMNTSQAPTIAECSKVYSREYSYIWKRQDLITRNAKDFKCPSAEDKAPLEQNASPPRRAGRPKMGSKRGITSMNPVQPIVR